MDRVRGLLVLAMALGLVASTALAYPLAGPAFGASDSDWFTTTTLEAVGADIDGYAAPGDAVFTAHPTYLVGSDDTHMLFRMPRMHYFAVVFNGTATGERFDRRLARALRRGDATLAMDDGITMGVLQRFDRAADAYERHYCRMGSSRNTRLFELTNTSLYRYVEDPRACPDARRPAVPP